MKKKNECIKKEGNKKGLGKQVDEIIDLDHDLKIINGNRLTIFFMGFERSSKPRNYRTQYFNLKKKDEKKYEIVEEDDDDDDELFPLMATKFHSNFDDNGEFCAEFEKSQVVVAIERHVAQRVRRRVTLADLFTADADGKTKAAPERGAARDFQKELPEVETVDDGSCYADKPKVASQPSVRNLRRVSTAHLTLVYDSSVF